MLLRLGIKWLQKKELTKALLMFMSCREYHLALFVMSEKRMLADAFFLKKYLVSRGMLQPVSPEAGRIANEIPDIWTLSATIDTNFASFSTDIGVDSKVLRTILA
jgi:hypothetical protein